MFGGEQDLLLIIQGQHYHQEIRHRRQKKSVSVQEPNSKGF